jgi:hypothetical protein
MALSNNSSELRSRRAGCSRFDQLKISLMCGRLAGFSFDRLVRFLVPLGSDVEIVVRPPACAAG